MAAPEGNQNAVGNSGGGTDTKYLPEYNEQAYKLALLGATNIEIADFFDVCERTIDTWKNIHIEFSAALKNGKIKADAEIASSLYDRAKGATWTEQAAFKIKVGPHLEKVEIVDIQRAAPPDTAAAVRWLTNRRPKDWRDKQEIDHSGTIEVDHKISDTKLAIMLLDIWAAAEAEAKSGRSGLAGTALVLPAITNSTT